MPTVQQSRTYHAARKNLAWAALDDIQVAALLADAEDYIRATYPLRNDLTPDEQRMLDSLICRLAGVFLDNPPEVTSGDKIKKESKELAGMKKETEFEARSSDPYTYITLMVQSFLRTTPSVTMGKLVRR